MKAKIRIVGPILMAVLMVFAMMPMAAGKAYAASGDPALNLGTDVLDENVNTSTAQITYYGRVKSCTAASDTVTINTAVNEQYNSDKKTDYASALQKVTIQKPKLTITAKDQTYEYNGKPQGEGDTVYGDPAQIAEKVTVEGLQAGDELTSIVVDGQGTDVGLYDLVPSNATINEKPASDKYDVTYVNGTLTIAPPTTVTNTVTFVDGQGKTLKTEKVESGKAATAPATPKRSGYTFTGWDKDFSKVTADMTVTAQWKKNAEPTPATYTVTFVDGQGKTLKTEKVKSGKAATAPADPKRTGYTFTGWNKDFSKVTADMTVTAQWKKNAEPAPVTKVSGTLLAKMTAKGKNSLILTWSKVKGAEGYDIFFIKCGKQFLKKVKTIKGNKTFKWTKTSLKTKKAYKAVVKAYITKNGKKTYVRTCPMVHAYTSGGTSKYTNSKGVTVKKTSVSLKSGKTYKLKANVTKLQKGKKLMPTVHAPKLRYVSSNKKIATVSRSGKITAKSKGSCKVYVIAVNGASKAVSVTVK